MVTESCPTDETLAAFAHRQLTPVDRDGVAAHLDGCESCRIVVRVGAQGTPPESLEITVPGPAIRIGARFGRFEIDKLLGAGGMGQVYAARDTELDRHVALKVLRPELGGAVVLEERLLRESRMTAKIAHPSVMTVYDVTRVGEVVAIAMELIRGETLALRCARESWRAIVALYLRAAEGLAAAHDAGIVHRDFKPDNVLVGDNDRVVVTDFGIARVALEIVESPRAAEPKDVKLTATGLAIGTPAYMAPEQLRGASVDQKADVFAFSASLWEALHGSRPFPGASVAEIEAAYATPPKPTTRLDRVLLRGLSIDPAKRPALRDLARDLGRVLHRRRKVAIGAGAIGLVGAGVAGALALASPAPADHPCAPALANFHYDHDAVAKALAGDPILTKIDNLAARWRVVHVETCHADRAPAQAQDVAACLEARRIEIEGIAADLVLDGPAYAKQLSSVGSLPDLCLHAPPALMFSRVPADPVLRRKVTPLRYHAWDAEKARNAGDPAKALAISEQLVKDSKGVWPPLEAEAQYLLGATQSLGSDPKAGFENLRQAAALAEASHHDYIAIVAWTQLITSATFDNGDPKRGLEYATYAESALARSEYPPEATAVFLYAKGGALVEMNRPKDAEQAFRKSRELSEEFHLPYLAVAIQGLGYLYEQEGQYPEAIQQYRDAIALLKDDASDVQNRITFYQRLATNLSIVGKNDEALQLAKECVRLADQTFEPKSEDRIETHLALVDAYQQAGDDKTALGIVDQAITDLQALGDARTERMGEALMERGQIHIDLEQWAEGRRDLERGCDIIAFRAGDGSSQEAQCRLREAAALDGLGKQKDAIALLEKIVPILETAHGADHPFTVTAKAALAAEREDVPGLEDAIARYQTRAGDIGVLGEMKSHLAMLVYPKDPKRGEAVMREAIADYAKATPLWAPEKREAEKALANHGKLPHHSH
ncbi:MAG: protein kinase [Kofleriaceae bacterium]